MKLNISEITEELKLQRKNLKKGFENLLLVANQGLNRINNGKDPIPVNLYNIQLEINETIVKINLLESLL